MNLSFCGSPVGNIAGDYWYTWPVSRSAFKRIAIARSRVHTAMAMPSVAA